MVKQRFSSADVAAEVACLRSRCLGMRVANVYDINPRTYVLKLARSGEDADKVLLLIESGTRFHTVQAMPEKADTPSNFTLKLRKHIRTRRLEAVKQLGVDRIVQMTFGSSPAACHLLLEFYAQGNVILADDKFEVLTLLRSHRDDAKGVAIMARHPYPIHTIHLRQPLSPQALQAALQAAAPDATLKGCVSSLLPYGPTVSEHCVLAASLEPQRLPAANPLTAAEQAALVAGVRQWEAWLDSCEDSQAPPQGYILTKPPPALAAAKGVAAPPPSDGGSEAAPAAAAGGVEGGAGAGGGAGAAGHPELYEGFEPAQLHQHRGKPCLHFPTFDAALEDFFGKIQGQRSALQQAAKEKAAVGKLEAVRRDHEKRLGSLGQEAEAAELKAALIEYNLGPVDAALASVREAVGSGMDWRDLARMVKEERRAGNPVAGLIDSLQLARGRVTLLLSNWLDEEDGDDEAATRPATKVEVDLELSAHANARAYYDSRRKHQVKHQKTLDANHKAIKAAEKKAVAQLKQVQRGAAAPVISRKPFWWERFHWFISSENYLVLSGRDAQQNELLVKRYMRKGDAYVHADLHGASSTVVKNHTPPQPIPPLTLSQAGQACVCRSQAWAAKVVTSAWWVHPEQVSRTAPTGEYLVTGSFMIRGRKNYLPPQPLVMGFGYLFGLAEESVPAHLGERAPRLRDGGEAAAEAAEEGHQEAGSSGGEEEEEEEEEEDEQQQQQQQEEGEGSTAAQPSALEAFLDASANTVAGGDASATSAVTLRRGGSKAGGGGAAAGAADALTASFQRYGLSSNTHESAGAPAATEAAADQEQEGEGERAGEAAGSGTRRHLSAKERQLKKKQQQGKAPQPQAAHQQQQQQQQQQQAAGSSGGAKKPAAQQQQEKKAGQQAAAVEAAPKARSGGAKGGKGKGGKHKYAEQDEEDRLLAQQLLQSGGTKKDRKQRKEERKERVAARKADRTGLSKQENTAEDIAKLTARPTAAPGSGGGTEDEGQASQGSAVGTDSDAGSQHSEQQQQQQQQQQAAQAEGDHTAAPEAPAADAAAAHTAAADEHAAQGDGGAGEEAAEGDDDSDRDGDGDEGGKGGEGGEGEGEGGAEASGGVDDAAEVAALLRGEQLEVLGDEERDKLTQLDQLTGQPRDSDVLLFALPVCAPYQVLAPYKLRVKLIPGTLKKGKAVRQAAELLLKGGEVSQRERDLIRAVPEPEAITCLCGTVKIQSAGLLKMKQAQKKGKGKK